MPNGAPEMPDPTKLLTASAEGITDLLNTGVRSINTLGAGIQGNVAKAASTLNLPAAPTSVPPIPEVPSISQGLNLPTLPAGLGLPPIPGIGGGGGGGGGNGGGAQAGEKRAAGAMGYGERTGSTCARVAGAGTLGYGES